VGRGTGKARIALAAVIGVVGATAGLIWISYLLFAAGVFESLRGPRLRITFQRAEPWCRTGAQGELSVRVAVENAGRAPAHGCVGRDRLGPHTHQEHVLTLAAFADDVDAPMRSLAATVAAGGEITTLHTLDVPADRPRGAWPAQTVSLDSRETEMRR
jgi:hypothetical protein